MKTLFKILFIGTALLMLASVFGGFALLHHAGPDMHITFNDDELSFGNDFGDLLGAGIGLFIAALVCCIVVPLALLLGVALPLLIMAGVFGLVLVALLGVGAVLGSPLILLGLLMFVVLRNRRRANQAVRTAHVTEHRTEPV
jgi:hypothetical protein